MQLSWQPGFSTHRKPFKKSIIRRPRWEASSNPSRPRELEFITEYPSCLSKLDGAAPASTSSPTPIHVVTGAKDDVPSKTGSIPSWPSHTSPFSSATAQCEPYLSENRAGFAEEGPSPDHTGTREAEVSTFDESSTYETEEISLFMNGTDAGTEFQSNDSNAVEDTIQWAISSNEHLTDRSMPTESLDLSDGLDGMSSPSGLSTLSYSDPRSLSYHLLHTIPAGILYDSHFERLAPIFERCRYILRGRTPKKSQLTEIR